MSSSSSDAPRFVAPELPVHDEHLTRVGSAVLIAFTAALIAVLLSPAPVLDALDVARHLLGRAQHRRVIQLDPTASPSPSPSTAAPGRSPTFADVPVPVADDPLPEPWTPGEQSQAMAHVLSRVLIARDVDVDLDVLAAAAVDRVTTSRRPWSHAPSGGGFGGAFGGPVSGASGGASGDALAGIIDIDVGVGGIGDVDIERRVGPATPPPAPPPPDDFICIYPAPERPSLATLLRPAVKRCARERLWGEVYVEDGVARVTIRAGDRAAGACIEAELRHRRVDVVAGVTAPFIFEPEPKDVRDEPPPPPPPIAPLYD